MYSRVFNSTLQPGLEQTRSNVALAAQQLAAPCSCQHVSTWSACTAALWLSTQLAKARDVQPYPEQTGANMSLGSTAAASTLQLLTWQPEVHTALLPCVPTRSWLKHAMCSHIRSRPGPISPFGEHSSRQLSTCLGPTHIAAFKACGPTHRYPQHQHSVTPTSQAVVFGVTPTGDTVPPSPPCIPTTRHMPPPPTAVVCIGADESLMNPS